ncbi:MAG: phosphatidylglycerophosphatase A [Dethiosulfovibrio peptidovorans]|nr:MAG: phosphatidylglycerophosphatase A [Dethiosulfovibrio peptidovorans]
MTSHRRTWAWAVATLGGLGGFSSMPGTVASLVACLAVLPVISTGLLGIGILLGSSLGVWASSCYALERGIQDPPEIVIDEAVGIWIAMLGHVTVGTLGYALPALFLFRVFDILKPVPVSTAERLPGGWGIIADDVVAGVLANALLWLLRWLYLQNGLSWLLG